MSYRMVVRASACRIAYCMCRSGTPLMRPAVQNVRRSACGLVGVVTLEARDKRKIKAIRCLKRYIAREIFDALPQAAAA